MSLAVKIVLPVLIVGALVWLYMTKYPAMVAQTQQPQQQTVQTGVEPVQSPASLVSTDTQLDADLGAIDTDMKTATDVSGDAQSFNDTPVAQTE